MMKRLIFISFVSLASCIVFAKIQKNNRKPINREENSMNYTIVSKPAFDIVGIQIKTDNSQGSKGFAPLWERFYAENIQQQIPHKIDDEVIAVYTDYEGDYTKPFIYFIGCRVSKVENLPATLIARKIPAGQYALFIAKGSFPQSLGTTWGDIWKSNLKRAYKADFEVYGARFFTHDDESKEVDIFIGI